IRGNRQTPVHHRRLHRLGPAGAAGGDLDAGLDASPGPCMVAPAPAGLRHRHPRGAAFLVDREIGLPRAAAVRGGPGGPAGLAPVEAAVPAPAQAAALSLSRTAAMPPAGRRSPPPPAAARAAATRGRPRAARAR